MDNSIVLNRIHSQIKEKVPVVVQPKPFLTVPPPVPPVKTETLRLLLEEIIPNDVVVEVPQLISYKVFNTIYDFVDWYVGREKHFTERQQTALNTLVQTRNVIGVGCACKRQQREQAAFAYFKTFWQNNKGNDLPARVMEVANAKSLEFGNFLKYPYTEKK